MKPSAKFILPIVTALAVSLSMVTNVVAVEEVIDPSPSPSLSPSPSISPSPSASPSASPEVTPTPSPNSEECVSTDVHGWFDQSTKTPVTGHFYNVSSNQECPNTLWVLVYGTNEDPSSPSFIDLQKYITTYPVNVAYGATDQIETFNAPQTDYCVLQYDLMDSPNNPEPPYLYTRDSIAVKRDGCDTVITTNSTGGSNDSEDKSETSAVLGVTTLASTGALTNMVLFALGFAGLSLGLWQSQKVISNKRK